MPCDCIQWYLVLKYIVMYLLAVFFLRLCLDLLSICSSDLREISSHRSLLESGCSLFQCILRYLPLNTAGVFYAWPLRGNSFQKLSTLYLESPGQSPTFLFLKEKGDTFLKIIVLCRWRGFPEINSRNTVLCTILR